jgi:hypothetical protein
MSEPVVNDQRVLQLIQNFAAEISARVQNSYPNVTLPPTSALAAAGVRNQHIL